MATKHPGQKQHIDALVLAFSHSRARALVGTDALRTVLAGQYRDLVQGDTLHLDEVWNLLEGQPGFDAAMVKPPLCRFKLWESDLEIAVALPQAMGRLSPLEVRSLADSCRVPAAELDRALGRGRYSDQALSQARAKATDAAELTKPPASTEDKPSRPWLTAAAAVVAVAGFAVAGYFVYQALSPPHWDRLDPGFAKPIPLAHAERSGFDVGGTLADDAWLRTPKADRESQLEAALETLRKQGVRNLFIVDKSGKVRASAQVYGHPPQIKVKLY